MSENSSDSVKETDAGDTASREDNSDSEPGDIKKEKEIGGRDGPDPTRYGDWEKDGRCIDF